MLPGQAPCQVLWGISPAITPAFRPVLTGRHWLGIRDAEILAREFEDSIVSPEPHEFSELDTHHVLVRLQEQGARLSSTEGKTLPPLGEATGQRKSIISRCRMHYAQPRARVAKGLEREFGGK